MSALERLLWVMARLRDPVAGCPWDRAQTFATIAPYTIEEAYEVEDAIAREDWDGLLDELGDLLLQVVYHAELARERGLFDFEAVAAAIADKMIRRHPHLFGDEDAGVPDAWGRSRSWESVKARERAAAGRASALDGLPAALPALMRARKLQARAAGVGFDWPELAPVVAKLREEIAELEAAQAAGAEERAEEVGDLLFAAVNLARHHGIDAETALRAANRKFERRFRHIEAALEAEGRAPAEAGLEHLDRLWERAKDPERKG
jgi:nucleoside triphosphate diphosphatase